MTTLSVGDGATSVPFARRFQPGWVFSAPRDLLMLGLPALVTLAAVIASFKLGRNFGASDANASWVAQFILGNSTHVILTFVLLGARRDMLHATKGQSRTVIIGSTVTFAITVSALLATHRYLYIWSDFVLAIPLIFAVHHTLSQVKGIWSLYNLRGRAFGLPPPPERERSAQQLFVPLALVLILIRFLFVPKTADSTFAYIQTVPTMEAILPFELTYVLVAAWFVFVGVLFRALLAGPGMKSYPKLIYLGTHALGVTLTLTYPGLGATFTAGVHGLEYYFLTARMLRPTEDEGDARLGRALVWPALIGAMMPLVVVGLVNAPFAMNIGLGGHAALGVVLRFTLNGIVMAHYFADAFIYRFRIPEVRKVALMRLGFDGGPAAAPVAAAVAR